MYASSSYVGCDYLHAYISYCIYDPSIVNWHIKNTYIQKRIARAIWGVTCKRERERERERERDQEREREEKRRGVRWGASSRGGKEVAFLFIVFEESDARDVLALKLFCDVLQYRLSFQDRPSYLLFSLFTQN